MRFDHVGVLVHDLEAAQTFARDVLGLGEPVRAIDVPEHGLKAAFFGLGEGLLEVFTLEEAGEERLPAAAPAVIDHVAVTVEDLDAEQARLAAHGVTFTGPQQPTEVAEPVDMRGKRHLWTRPETSGGFRLQLTEVTPPSA